MTEEKVTTESEVQEPASNPEEIVWIDPAQFNWQFASGRLQLRDKDKAEEEWKDVGIYRLFPLSDPECWLSVVDKDNKELGIIRELHGWPHEPLALIREELNRRYLVPQVLRIISCRDLFDFTTWEMETDRGPIKFNVRRQQENIQRPLPHRVTLIDTEGNRYDIADINSLDEESRRMLEERI
ncbi:MAG: DUF1854 domain-containing protein [Armatimonadota bacterium]